MEVITHRRGSTYEVQCQYTDTAGVPIDVTNTQVKSQIRTSTGALVADCVVIFTDIPAGKFMLRVLNTGEWPVGNLVQDIQYILTDGRKINTSPITINVITSVTQ
jgi:hypothetical protein